MIQPVGVNLNFFRDSESAIACADLAKRGREWFKATPGGTADQDLADVMANYPYEYPTEPAVSTVLIPGYQRPNREQNGGPLRLVLRYDAGPLPLVGSNDVLTTVVLSGDRIEPDGTYSNFSGMVEKYYLLKVDGSTLKDEGLVNIFVKTANSTQIRNDNLDMKIELWVDENHQDAYNLDNKEVFFDQFITRLQELAPGVIRTGPTWSNNNSASPVTSFVGNTWLPDWTQRPLPNSSRWSDEEGVPWEVHAWLANKLQTNLWICIPFFQFDPLNTDDNEFQRAKAKEYAMGLGALMAEELDTSLNVYVEYSNEAWNAGFTTNGYLTSIIPGNSQADISARAVLFGQMAADMFDWFLQGFYPNSNNTQPDTRVQLVAMGRSGDLTWATKIADELDADQGNGQTLNLVDAMGCSLYFPPDQQDVDDWKAEKLANGIVSDMTLYDDLKIVIQNGTSGLSATINDHSAAAAARALKFYSYEGGPSLIGGTYPALIDDFARFQKTQLMADLITEEMNDFVRGDLIATSNPVVTQFCYFAFCAVPDSINGDFLSITDLYAGTPEKNVDLSPQLKIKAISDFNNN